MTTNEANRTRLILLVELLGITLTDVAVVAGVSRPLISRIINEGLDGSGVWVELEKRLPELISKRRKAFFEVEAVQIDKVKAVMEQLKKVA